MSFRLPSPTALRGLAFHLLLGCYFLAAGPRLTEASRALMKDDDGPLPWLGGLILGVLILEGFAFPGKISRLYSRENSFIPRGAPVFLLWMLHTAVSAILLIIALKAFAPAGSGETILGGWGMVGLFVIVIKELYFLLLLLVDPETPPREGRIPEWVLDLSLLLYAAVTHSLIWLSMADGSPPGSLDSFTGWLDYTVAGLVFLLLYLPLRIPYWIGEWIEARTPYDRFVLIAGVLLAMIAALSCLR